MDGLTQVAVVDDQPDQVVLEVRYFYRDRFKDDTGRSGFSRECTGFAGRRFTLAGDATGGVKVLEMTGPRRS
jgi:hypothetical protein